MTNPHWIGNLTISRSDRLQEPIFLNDRALVVQKADNAYICYKSTSYKVLTVSEASFH